MTHHHQHSATTRTLSAAPLANAWPRSYPSGSGSIAGHSASAPAARGRDSQLACSPNATGNRRLRTDLGAGCERGELRLGSHHRRARRAPRRTLVARPVATLLAFFGALFLAVFFALGRDQLTPRVSGTRELARLLDLPVLVGVPFVGGRSRRRRVLSGVELEAYQTLRSALELSLPANRRPHVLLVTGAMHAEGKTTATARLGSALPGGTADDHTAEMPSRAERDVRAPPTSVSEISRRRLDRGFDDELLHVTHELIRADARQGPPRVAQRIPSGGR